jgi:uncharacterized membrane protein YpjA
MVKNHNLATSIIILDSGWAIISDQCYSTKQRLYLKSTLQILQQIALFVEAKVQRAWQFVLIVVMDVASSWVGLQHIFEYFFAMWQSVALLTTHMVYWEFTPVLEIVLQSVKQRKSPLDLSLGKFK